MIFLNISLLSWLDNETAPHLYKNIFVTLKVFHFKDNTKRIMAGIFEFNLITLLRTHGIPSANKKTKE